MPLVARGRTVPAAPEAVWALVSDPRRLPEWWPGVQRVEEASPEAWTKVLRSSRGKALRADYTRLRAEPLRSLVWRQEIAESPFERILSEAVTEVTLEPAKAGGTRVELRARQRLRGLARFGAFMVRRATRRQLEEALEALERAVAHPA